MNVFRRVATWLPLNIATGNSVESGKAAKEIRMTFPDVASAEDFSLSHSMDASPPPEYLG